MPEPRLDPSHAEQGIDSPWWSVHAARYKFALEHICDRCVLDIACGTGYGMVMMLQNAATVIGVDLDPEAASKARIATLDRRAGVTIADGCSLPFADSTFDVVTSFETIEHLQDRGGFLAELRRVLKLDGVCLLSTPNAHYTHPVDGKPRNPYHVHEYTPEELYGELARHFSELVMVGQGLRSEFKMSPYWEDQEQLPKTLLMQSRRLMWRALNRSPRSVADIVSRALWGHDFLPTPDDFVFAPEIVSVAPVTVAVCRRSV